MKNLTKLCASLFVAPLLLTGAWAVDTTDNTKAAVDKGETADVSAQSADVSAKSQTDNTTKAAVDKGEAADVSAQTANDGAKGPKNNTKAAVDNGETVAAAMNVNDMHQGTGAADVNTTRRVRKAIRADHSLSPQARNAKVITANGVVMLRGPVKSDAERDNLGAKALRFAGTNRVENNLDVVAIN